MHRLRQTLFQASSLWLLSGCWFATVSDVSYRAHDSWQWYELSEPEVDEFARIWGEREEVPRPEGFRSEVRVIIVKSFLGDHHGTTYFYDPRGYLTALTIKASNPFYRIKDPVAFNALVRSGGRARCRVSR